MKVERHPLGTVLVVTHGGNLMTLARYLNGEPLSSYWKYYRVNAAVCTLLVENGRLVLVAMNDTLTWMKTTSDYCMTQYIP